MGPVLSIAKVTWLIRSLKDVIELRKRLSDTSMYFWNPCRCIGGLDTAK